VQSLKTWTEFISCKTVPTRSRGRVPMSWRGSSTCQSTLDSRQRPSSAARQPRHQWSPGDTQHSTWARWNLHLRSLGLPTVHLRSSSNRRSYCWEMYVHYYSSLIYSYGRRIYLRWDTITKNTNNFTYYSLLKQITIFTESNIENIFKH